jgi:sulfur carrier protein ThiS
MSEKKVWFRFYEELNDFLPKNRKKVRFQIECEQKQSVKDAIESLGIPHTEIDLILVNGQSVSFDYHILPDDNISVYPVFESLDISRVTRLRNKPLRIPSFILDVHLGKLAKYLRMTGFDTLYENRLDDNEIVEIAQSVIHQLKSRTKIYFNEFFKCSSCGKVYWKGSHFERMQNLIVELADVE